MSEQIIEIIGKILAAAAVALMSYISVNIVPKIKEWLDEKIGAANTKKLENLIDAFVRSAQIQFKEEDPSGEKRKDYVMQNLISLGYAITEEVNAYIESRVLNLNLEEKSVN